MTNSCILATQSYDFFLTTCHLANASQQSFCRYVIGRTTDANNDQELIQSMLSVLVPQQFTSLPVSTAKRFERTLTAENSHQPGCCAQ
jgi:hypothetical protein